MNCNFSGFYKLFIYIYIIGVVLLPFIDETRLLKAAESVYPQLDEDEITRNTMGSEILCFSNKHKLYDELCVLYSKRKSDQVRVFDFLVNIFI